MISTSKLEREHLERKRSAALARGDTLRDARRSKLRDEIDSDLQLMGALCRTVFGTFDSRRKALKEAHRRLDLFRL